MCITGGDLELSKTLVYLIDYLFIEGNTIPHMKSKQDALGDIILPPEQHEDVHLSLHDEIQIIQNVI